MVVNAKQRRNTIKCYRASITHVPLKSSHPASSGSSSILCVSRQGLPCCWMHTRVFPQDIMVILSPVLVDRRESAGTQCTLLTLNVQRLPAQFCSIIDAHQAPIRCAMDGLISGVKSWCFYTFYRKTKCGQHCKLFQLQYCTALEGSILTSFRPVANHMRLSLHRNML